MKTYFMAAEVRNDHGNIVGRYNATFITGPLEADIVFEKMRSGIATKCCCGIENVFVTAFNSV